MNDAECQNDDECEGDLEFWQETGDLFGKLREQKYSPHELIESLTLMSN